MGPSWTVGLGWFTASERMEGTLKPEAEYTGRPSPDGEVIEREGGGSGARTREGVCEMELDQPAD